MDAVAIGSIVAVVVSVVIIAVIGVRLTQLIKRDAERHEQK